MLSEAQLLATGSCAWLYDEQSDAWEWFAGTREAQLHFSLNPWFDQCRCLRKAIDLQQPVNKQWST